MEDYLVYNKNNVDIVTFVDNVKRLLNTNKIVLIQEEDNFNLIKIYFCNEYTKDGETFYVSLKDGQVIDKNLNIYDSELDYFKRETERLRKEYESLQEKIYKNETEIKMQVIEMMESILNDTNIDLAVEFRNGMLSSWE